MNEKNTLLIENTIKEYYFNRHDLIQVPNRSTEREFGYQKFNSGMIRHISVKNNKELHFLLMKEIPSDVYCSNAYYAFPNLPMTEKDWRGADLIFDIDAKDLSLPCRKNHTINKCVSCNISIPTTTSICPKCGNAKFEIISVSCKNCITESKKEVTKLVEILVSDLNINRKEIEVYFSGNEGFHIKVISNEYESLGSQERADLVDYIMFNSALPESFGIRKQNDSKILLPYVGESGWRGRVARSLFASKTKTSKITNEIISNGYFAFQVRLEELKKTIGVRIDPKVTMDIHRIFRFEGSINSKSGMSKILCNDLDSFDPFLKACLLSDDSVEIKADCPFQIRLKNKKFGPYENEVVSLPKYAAVYMLCKGLGNAI